MAFGIDWTIGSGGRSRKGSGEVRNPSAASTTLDVDKHISTNCFAKRAASSRFVLRLVIAMAEFRVC